MEKMIGQCKSKTYHGNKSSEFLKKKQPVVKSKGCQKRVKGQEREKELSFGAGRSMEMDIEDRKRRSEEVKKKKKKLSRNE